MADAYFTTSDGRWFRPTDHTRGPWNPEACHAGPPTALMARAVEGITDQPLVRLTVELMRPIPMSGFRVQAEVRRPGRQVTLSEAEIFDDDRIYARAFGLHLRVVAGLAVRTVETQAPDFSVAVPGPFPIRTTAHAEVGFNTSIESRYDPSASIGEGGPTIMWMRTRVPILAGEEPTPFQKICPLADSGNGISYNQYLDEVHFVNPDLTISVHREPRGDWFASSTRSYWEPTGIGRADAELFDRSGPFGRATQNLLLFPPD